MSMRFITLDGRVGKDGAKVAKSATGKDFIRFSLANDVFSNGAVKTEWFDVSCFDPFCIEKKLDLLKQGRYVIIQGTLNSEVAVRNGKCYLNHYVKATNIEIPSLGGKKEEGNEVQVSTYTGGTRSDKTAQAPVQEASPAPQAAVSQSSPAGWGAEDDLPF